MDSEAGMDNVSDFSPFWENRKRRSLWKRVFAGALPAHVLRPMAFEFRMLVLRARSRRVHRQYAHRSELLVNIGAGGRGKIGWVNLDGFPDTNITCRFDARKWLPFADGSVRSIFSEHFLEHLDYSEEVPGFLRECVRVLKPGGVMRIIVPDAEKYLRAYVHGGWDDLAAIRPLYDDRRDYHLRFRYNTPMELINVVFRQWEQHKFAYDFETMAFVLERAGFQVIRQKFRQSVDPALAIDLEERSSESLYVEAIKPQHSVGT
jgi:predicted SAM-dependent methyltransferase